MDITGFQLAPDAARRAFLEYKADATKTGSAEDAAIMRGYKAIASGRRVISLPQVMKAGGVKPNGYPNLAIARADQSQVTVDFRVPHAECEFYTSERYGKPLNGTRVIVPAGSLPCPKDARGNAVERWRPKRTIVPSIPPRFRPAYALKNYHILFEVESWELLPPLDPALLKYLGGGIYAVLAIWDLTEIERAVIGVTRGAV